MQAKSSFFLLLAEDLKSRNLLINSSILTSFEYNYLNYSFEIGSIYSGETGVA